MKNEVAVLLNEIQYRTGESLTKIAEKIAVTRPYLNKVKLSNEGSETVKEKLLRKYSDILHNMLYPGNEDSFQVRLRNQKLNKGQKQIPFYDASAQAGGDMAYTEMTPVSAPSGTIDVGDLLSDSTSAIRIYGNSMIPNYPPGCVVGLSKCIDQFIEPGEVYVIETHDRRMLKRLFYKNDDPETGYIMCYSDNLMKFEGGPRHDKPAYPVFYVRVEDIVNLYTVTGVIKRNSNSVIINR